MTHILQITLSILYVYIYLKCLFLSILEYAPNFDKST